MLPKHAEYQAFLRPVYQERPAGVEPALPPWQGGRLPLHHGRVDGVPNCQRTKSTGRDSNPRRRITGAVSSPLDDQCIVCQWDQRDSNPHLAGLRVRVLAASTLPQSRSSVGAEGVEPSTWLLIRGLLSPLSYAPASRAGGTRTHTCRIKSPVCCRYTTTPNAGRAYAFQSRLHRIAPAPRLPVVALRIELSATRLSAAFGQPALDYRANVVSSVGMAGLEPASLVLPKHAGSPLPYIPSCQSERPDLNRRSPGPRPGAIPRLRYVLLVSSSCGSRTRLCRLERPISSNR